MVEAAIFKGRFCTSVTESLKNHQQKCKRKFNPEELKLLMGEANNHFDKLQERNLSITGKNALRKDHSYKCKETSNSPTVTLGLIQCILTAQKSVLADHIGGLSVKINSHLAQMLKHNYVL